MDSTPNKCFCINPNHPCFKNGGCCYRCVRCCDISDRRDCCHCYSTEYQNNADSVSEEISEKFFVCPGTYCTISSCLEFVDGETELYEWDTSSCCCNGIRDPPCHDCALIFCPIACVLDIMCLIPRLFVSTKSPVKKCLCKKSMEIAEPVSSEPVSSEPVSSEPVAAVDTSETA